MAASTYIQQASSVMNFWSIYIVVVFGILGFVIQKGDSIKQKDAYVFMIAFALFAISNIIPMYEAQSALVKIHAKLNHKETFPKPGVIKLVIAHVVFDIVVLAFLYSRPNNAKQQDQR